MLRQRFAIANRKAKGRPAAGPQAKIGRGTSSEDGAADAALQNENLLDKSRFNRHFAFMQSENPLIADIVKMANSAAGTMAGMPREARESARERMREAMGGMDFVSREEFETVKAMAQKAREQADALEAKIAEMEAMVTPKDNYRIFGKILCIQ